MLRKLYAKIIEIMKTNQNNILKSEKKLLEENLSRLLLNSKESVVISLKGSWGIGKSHFWHNFAKKFEHGQYAYVSLFGKTSLDNIKQDIICQVSSTSKIISKINKRIGASKYLGIDIASALSMLSQSDFNNITICFDDFERVSSKIDIKDVIGLISELKEQKKCKIVIINNNDQLKESDELNNWKILEVVKDDKGANKVDSKYLISRTNYMESFELFSEKIIDYEFLYAPSIKENFLIIKGEIKYFNPDLILNFLEWTNANDKINKNFNIRILKKLINSLNIFEFLCDYGVKIEIRDSISAYIFEKIYDKKLHQFDFSKTNIMSVHEIINSSLERSFVINQDLFIDRIKSIQERLEHIEIRDKSREIYDRYNFDLRYSVDSFKIDMYNLFCENQENIVRVIGIDSLAFYIKLLSKLDPQTPDKYDLFFREASKKFIDSLAENDDTMKSLLNNNYDENFKDYPDIIKYLAEKKEHYESAVTTNTFDLISLLKGPRERSGWTSSDVELLSSIPFTTHKKCMKESREYLNAAFQFVRWANGFSGERPFNSVCENITSAMRQLSEENKDYKDKLTNIINLLENKIG